MTYSSERLVFVIPTKDRPEQLKEVLRSLERQTARPGEVIVVDGGKSVESIVSEFQTSLNTRYFVCDPPGQIRQRTLGISKVRPEFPLVAFFDDDIVLAPDAVEVMLAFWNRAPVETAGVSFNLTNIPSYRSSFARRLALIDGDPGSLLPSGYNVSVANQEDDLRSQWLPGGCTVWRQDIVLAFPQSDLNTRWAVGEDVRFSYPIGRRYPLYVCGGAKVEDTGQTSVAPSPERSRYQGRKEALAYFYLVELHPELSKLKCLWMLMSSSCMLLVRALAVGRPSVHKVLGQFVGIGIIVARFLSGRSVRSALED